MGNRIIQAKDVNLSKYKIIENCWKEAIKPLKGVSVSIKIDYNADGLRPVMFQVI